MVGFQFTGLFKIQGLIHRRYYTWSPSPIRSGLEFVPMLWGEDQVQQFAQTMNETVANNKVSAVLGFNE